MVRDIDGVKSFITYTGPDALNWRYVRITPYSVIFNKIESMEKNLISICAIILVFSFILAFTVSRLLSKPIDKTLMRLKTLEMEKRDSNKILRQEFLSNLLLSRRSCNLQIIEKFFSEYDVNLDPGVRILMLLLRIDNYKEFTQKYTLEDINLYKFGIGNIVSRFAQVFTNETVDMGEDCYTFKPNNDENTL